MRFAALLAAAFLSGLGTAGAQTPNPIDCDKASTTVELNYCADIAFMKADGDLNDVYQKLIAGNAKADRGEGQYSAAAWEKALRASQRAWVAFRDAECKDLVPIEWSGGTGTTMAVLGCMTAHTEARTKELRERLDR
jgi:uncharacterized protein YecT (DUF1311 family)